MLVLLIKTKEVTVVVYVIILKYLSKLRLFKDESIFRAYTLKCYEATDNYPYIPKRKK
jgi:hypothetical protein